MPLPRTSWRRRPLLVLIILLLLLVIGYAARALDGNHRSGSRPAGPHATGGLAHYGAGDPARYATGDLAQSSWTAQRGGRLAAKAAMPSCACSPAK